MCWISWTSSILTHINMIISQLSSQHATCTIDSEIIFWRIKEDVAISAYSSLFSTNYNPGMSAFHFTFCTQPQTASHLDAVWLRTDLVSSNDSPTTLFYDQLTFRRINACLSTGKNYTFGGINISECLRHIPKFFSSIFNIIWKTYSSELLYLDPTYDMFPGEYIDASGVGGHLVSWDKYEGYCGRQ